MARNAVSFLANEIERPGKPGAIVFVKHAHQDVVAGFNHACPCGCGKWSFIRLNPENWAPDTKPMWSRTGDDLHMTLTPSIGVHPLENGRYHWHGFLCNGVFEEA